MKAETFTWSSSGTASQRKEFYFLLVSNGARDGPTHLPPTQLWISVPQTRPAQAQALSATEGPELRLQEAETVKVWSVLQGNVSALYDVELIRENSKLISKLFQNIENKIETFR